MTTLTNSVSPNAMQALGWALLHFLWQGTAVAALAAAAMALCRHASTRYVVGVGALVLMLLAPLSTFFLYSQHRSGAAEILQSSLARRVAASPATTGTGSARSSAESSPIGPSLDALPWLVEAWLLGVAFFSLRSAGGFILLERERHKQSTPPSARVLAICQTLQQRLGLERAVLYCECKWLQAPA